MLRSHNWLMDDDLFPSGPWTGFYNYTGPEDRHRMDLQLTFADGRISGDGIDDVGRFLIAGRYDANARECWWTKTYPGSHDVSYRGFAESHGIWGTWEIPPWGKGGFHIWPRRVGNGAHEHREVAVEIPGEQQTVISGRGGHANGCDPGNRGEMGLVRDVLFVPEVGLIRGARTVSPESARGEAGHQ